MLIERMIEKYDLTVDGDGNIELIPLNRFNFQTSPLPEGVRTIKVTPEEYFALKLREAIFDSSLTMVIFPTRNQLLEAQNEVALQGIAARNELLNQNHN